MWSYVRSHCLPTYAIDATRVSIKMEYSRRWPTQRMETVHGQYVGMRQTAPLATNKMVVANGTQGILARIE